MSTRAARGAVHLVVRTLPPEQRERYRRELLAEVHGLDASAARAYAVGLLRSAPELRRELRLLPEVDERPAVPLLCRLNIRHHWKTCSTEDGHRYRLCARCGRDDPWDTRPQDRMGAVVAGWGEPHQ